MLGSRVKYSILSAVNGIERQVIFAKRCLHHLDLTAARQAKFEILVSWLQSLLLWQEQQYELV